MDHKQKKPEDSSTALAVGKSTIGSEKGKILPPLPKGPPPLPRGPPPIPKLPAPLPKAKAPLAKLTVSALRNAETPTKQKNQLTLPKQRLVQDESYNILQKIQSAHKCEKRYPRNDYEYSRIDQAQKDFKTKVEPIKKYLNFKQYDRSGALKACKSAILLLDSFFNIEMTDSDYHLARKRKRNERLQGYKDSFYFHKRTVAAYEIIQQVRAGTFGEVYKARDRTNGDIVALKKTHVHNEKEGFPLTALREIKILQNLRHENIVHLKEIVPSKASPKDSDLGVVYIVLEYLDNDLTGLMESRSMKLSEAHIKCYMKQLLEGLHYIHTNNVIHRDIKAANLLVANNGYLRIGDWGLSRSWVPGAKYTTRVVTLWYRAPELLIGDKTYTPAIDLWAVGCIFAELLGRKSILPGKDELSQLKLILQLCGTPDIKKWPQFHAYLKSKKLELPTCERSMEKRFSWMPPIALSLLSELLTMNPTHRITAADALDHDYFWEGTRPCKPEQLPKIAGDGLHEFEVKLRANSQQQHRQKPKFKGNMKWQRETHDERPKR